jgi:signal transduction histidine kinase
VLFGRKLEDPWRCDAYEVLDGRKPPQADNASQEDFMQLSEFILTNIEPIAREWEEFAKTCTPAAIGMTRSAILDDVTQILEAVANDMEQPQTPAEQDAKGMGQRLSDSLGRVAASHVGLRIDSRFDLAQIVSEYRAMRASVLRLWSSSRREGLSDETMAVIRFDEAIDQSIAEIVPTYLRREAQYRDRFFGMLGHDLRGPINVIHLCAEILIKNGEHSRDERRHARRISKSCDRLDRMVKDILDFTRGRFGEPMHITRVPADLGTILRDIIDEVQCANPEVAIDFATGGDLTGEWDSERLSQLLWNLVANAIQHGGAKQVGVRVENENDRVVIEVHNEGLPIPQDVMTNIFNPLGRERYSEPHRAGLGLGLFICKEIVTAHGGTITATSAMDAGTTFAVRLNSHAG